MQIKIAKTQLGIFNSKR